MPMVLPGRDPTEPPLNRAPRSERLAATSDHPPRVTAATPLADDLDQQSFGAIVGIKWLRLPASTLANTYRSGIAGDTMPVCRSRRS